MSEVSEDQQMIMNSSEGYNTPNILQIRLTTKELISDIRKTLSGKEVEYYENEKGDITRKVNVIGTPLCNDKGVQQIMQIVGSIINNAVVQGNYDEKELNIHIKQFHKELAREVVLNNNAWGIKKNDYGIITLMLATNLIPTYLSRLKNNKERESYGTMIVKESNVVEQNKGFSIGR